MTNVETAIRVLAVVAAAAVVAGPYLVAQARRLAVFRKAPVSPAAAPMTPDDAHIVLDMARRLQASGNAKGVELCQQLIDVLLQPAAEGTKT